MTNFAKRALIGNALRIRAHNRWNNRVWHVTVGQLQPRDDAPPSALVPGRPERRLDDIKSRIVFTEQNAFSLPQTPEIIGSRAAVSSRSVTRLFAIQHHPNSVAGMLAIERSLECFINQTISGSDHFRQRADLAQVESPAGEGQNLYHVKRITFDE